MSYTVASVVHAETTGSLLYILGTCLIAFSQNLAMLLCGRFLLGASVGMIQPGMIAFLPDALSDTSAAPPYIAELAPPEGRGSLTGMSRPPGDAPG